MRFVGWAVLVIAIVGILVLNASRSATTPSYGSDYQDRNSDGQVVCFDDGAGGMNCT